MKNTTPKTIKIEDSYFRADLIASIQVSVRAYSSRLMYSYTVRHVTSANGADKEFNFSTEAGRNKAMAAAHNTWQHALNLQAKGL